MFVRRMKSSLELHKILGDIHLENEGEFSDTIPWSDVVTDIFLSARYSVNTTRYMYVHTSISTPYCRVLGQPYFEHVLLNHVPAWNNGHVLCILITRYKYSSSGAILYY